MPATANKTVWQDMTSKLGAMGGVQATCIGEVKASAAQSGLVMVIPMAGRIDTTVLNAPREVHTVSIVRLENELREPTEGVEFDLDQWRAEILEDIWGDFDLGGTIAYALPAETTWEYGFVVYNNTRYRYVDITFSYRVDPAAVFVA